MRKIAVMLIIIGIAVAGYPLGERMYTSYMQKRLMQEFAEEYANLQPLFEEAIRSENHIEDPFAVMDSEDADEDGSGEQPATDDESTRSEEQKQATPPPPKPKAIGVLKIDKITLTLPILQGASNSNLKIGAGLLNGTTAIGEPGNTALAAHRSHTYGRFFNRLNEVEIGDWLDIDTGQTSFRYQVYNIVIVEPQDVSVLAGNRVDSVLTLITCDPIDTGTHRLIVQAILDQEQTVQKIE